MATIGFDAYEEAIKELTDGGLEDSQAKAIVKAIGKTTEDRLSTKEDIRTLKGEVKEDIQALRGEVKEDIQALRGEVKEDIQALRGEVKEDIQALRGEVKEDIQALRGEVKEDIHELRGEIKEDLHALERRMFGIIVGIAGLAVAVSKLIG